MATRKPESKPDSLLNIPLLIAPLSQDIDGDISISRNPTAEVKIDREFERAVRSAQRDFKNNLSRELRRRRFFNPKHSRPRKGTALPPPIDDPLAEMIQRHINTAELTLDGVRELPSGDNIIGAVLIIRKCGTDELLCSLDKGKHGRWGFPGGRFDPNDLNIAHTLLRELREETHLRGKRFRYVFVALVPLVGAPDKSSAVFFTEIPEEIAAKVRPGREQRELRFFSRADIYEMILKREFLENHANYLVAWE